MVFLRGLAAFALHVALFSTYAGAMPTTLSPRTHSSSPDFQVEMAQPRNVYVYIPQERWQTFLDTNVYHAIGLEEPVPVVDSRGPDGVFEAGIHNDCDEGDHVGFDTYAVDAVVVEVAAAPHIMHSRQNWNGYGIFLSQVRRFQFVRGGTSVRPDRWTINDQYNNLWDSFGPVTGMANYGSPHMQQLDATYLSHVAAAPFTRALLHFLLGPLSILSGSLQATYRTLIGWDEGQEAAPLLPLILPPPPPLESMLLQYLSATPRVRSIYNITEEDLRNRACESLIRTMALNVDRRPSSFGRRDEGQEATVEVPGACENAGAVFCREQPHDAFCKYMNEKRKEPLGMGMITFYQESPKESHQCSPQPRVPERWEWTQQSKEELCSQLYDLSLGFQLLDGSGDGTWDSIVLSFGDGLPEHIITEGPSAGFHEWQQVNLKRIFGSEKIRLDQIKKLSLLTRVTHWWIGGDEWDLLGLKLKARCVGSEIPIFMESFKDIHGAMAWNNPIKHVNVYDAIVWQGDVNPDKDWVARPLCTHVESMTLTVHLANENYAETSDDLLVETGDWQRQIAHAPLLGTAHSVDIDLERAYNSRVVPLADIQRISIKTRGGYDAAKISKVNIHANCGTLPIAIEREFNEWIYDGQRFDLALAPEDWVSV
ncbi:hypothetical protein ED733_000868 [Metarhizium rileyi]|uniref:Enterotoxin n=1 Tax=Metarhizium rileyi (strain RCEF 4871) TaxID=1649241 RepID=A0A5C6G329_METRR|nr:hypothetical protein ED733_000868 [Metarhizium rileyi]